MPEEEVGGEREGIADKQVRARPGLLEAIPSEHISLRGADELHVKGLDRLGERGQPNRDGRALLDLAFSAHHRLRDTADHPLGPGLDANGLQGGLSRGSVLPGGDHHGEGDLGSADLGPGPLHGRLCGRCWIGVGRERRADPHPIDPPPAMTISSRLCAARSAPSTSSGVPARANMKPRYRSPSGSGWTARPYAIVISSPAIPGTARASSCPRTPSSTPALGMGSIITPEAANSLVRSSAGSPSA